MQNIHGQFERETFINIIHTSGSFYSFSFRVQSVAWSQSVVCSMLIHTRLENKVSARVVPNEKRKKTCTRNQTAPTIYIARRNTVKAKQRTQMKEKEMNRNKKIEIKIKERNPFVCHITMQKYILCALLQLTTNN